MPVLIFLLTLTLLSSCNPVDNYLLGKDNSETPASLQAAPNKINIKIKQEKNLNYQLNPEVSPVIINNVIYAAGSNKIFAVTKDSFAQIWSSEFEHKIISGIAASKNILIFGTDDAKVLALDAQTGKLLWQTQLSTDVLAKAVIHNSSVYVKTVGGRVYALNAQHGEVIWVNDHGAPHLILKASSSPSIFGSNLLVAFADGKVEDINIETGETLWQKQVVHPSGASDVENLMDIDATPVIKDGVAYIASFQNFVTAISLENGKSIWEHQVSAYKDIALHEKTIFITDIKDVLWALDASTGDVAWRQDSLKARKLTSPLAFKNLVIFADMEGFVHILDNKSGEILTRLHLDSAISNTPIVDQNTIYIFANNGIIYKLE